VSAAVFEDRRVFMRDNRECKHEPWGQRPSIVVAAGILLRWGEDEGWHDGMRVPIGAGPGVLDFATDDPDEAQAAFDKGAEYVRTGVL
jgi:hypothetical protein